MALSDAAKGSLSGLWGGYDFYLIRDGHFKEPSEIVERFLGRYQPRWAKSSRSIDKEFVVHPKKVRELLTEWAEKKLALVAESQALPTLYTSIMFKQLLYDHETINFGSIKTNWKKKVDIAAELEQYKPWSVVPPATAPMPPGRSQEGIIGRRSLHENAAVYFRVHGEAGRFLRQFRPASHNGA